jgi:endonuclease-8
MTGSWHRYRPGEPWRRSPARARLVLEVPGAVAVCFDAPVIELFDRRAEALHPTLARLGPDLLADDWGSDAAAEAHRRLRDPARAAITISEALLDQRALAGIGNIWRNETMFAEQVNPWTPVADVDDETLGRLIARAHDLLQRSMATRPGGMPMAVYRRAGRPCRRCGTLILSAPLASAIPRTTYWCPGCQPARRGGDGVDQRPV